MAENREIAQSAVDTLYDRLKSEAEAGGYFFNPDASFAKDLVRSLLVNQNRYGYMSCPCRLAAGQKEKDADIVCPCEYRDADVAQFGACYCALYVSSEVARGLKQAAAIPERRPPAAKRNAVQSAPSSAAVNSGALKYPVWRCKVCGYLCARDEAPDTCPVCKAKKDRFERFI